MNVQTSFLQEAQLQSNNPAHWPVQAGWQPLVEDFFSSTRGQQLLSFLGQRLERGAVIFPPTPLKALELTAPQSVRAVIIGQDPYHAQGQAHGLAFSVPPGVKLPPSLKNIFKELNRDLGWPLPQMPRPGGNLSHWAKKGVLLLNTCLTVEQGQPASHAGKGWEALTDAIIAHISHASTRPIVFMLWGAHAQSKQALIEGKKNHLVLTANHPSPLSAMRAPKPFIGCGHFSAAKRFLQQHPN